MSVIRTYHNRENPYSQLNKSVLQDPNITHRARGFWAFCLSHPSDWKFYIKDLVNRSVEGRTAIYTTIEELINNGYAIKIEYWEKSENGRMKGGGVEYIFLEFKANEEEIEKIKQEFQEKLKLSFRYSEIRNPGTRTSENVPLLNTDCLLKTETPPPRRVVAEAQSAYSVDPKPIPPKEKPKTVEEPSESVEVIKQFVAKCVDAELPFDQVILQRLALENYKLLRAAVKNYFERSEKERKKIKTPDAWLVDCFNKLRLRKIEEIF